MRWKEHIARLWRHAKWPVTWTLWAVLMAWLAVALWHGCNGSASPGDRHPLPTAVRDSLLSVDCSALPHVVHRRYTAFEVDYDTALHLPRCVAYELRRDMLGGDAQRYDDFVADPSVPGCAQPEAYHGSGMHRGHMAPAADMANNEQAMRESFFMTNICPQDASLNEGGWARLEEKVREWTLRDSALLVFAALICCGLALRHPLVPAGYENDLGVDFECPLELFPEVVAVLVRVLGRVVCAVVPAAGTVVGAVP